MQGMLNEPVKKFTHKVLIIDGGENVEYAARKMKEEKIGSVIVSYKDMKGIVTERDVLYKVVAEGKNPREVKLKDIMSYPLITIDAEANLSEAIALMSKNNIRRMIVIENNKIIGMVSQRAVTGDIRTEDVPIAEVDIPVGVICPYCESKFSDRDELSKHIDRIHLGSGLLEGDIRKY